MLEKGTIVENFYLKDAFGKRRSLNEFLGKKVVIFFYPKNNTTGCTKEVCSFRDNINQFKKQNVEIIGISRDSVRSHYKFTQEYDLPFILLSDQDKKIIEYFGVLNVESQSKRAIGAKRITYLLDEKGIVIHVFENVKPANHAEEVVEYLNTCKKL